MNVIEKSISWAAPVHDVITINIVAMKCIHFMKTKFFKGGDAEV
jgi:hypothetical protein